MTTPKPEATTPEEIAGRLTKAQKDALGHLSDKPWSFPQRWLVLVGYSLEKLGLSRRTFLLDRSYLTPLGLKVRASLQRDDQ